MRVHVEWSESEQVATIFHEDVAIRTLEDIAEWKRQLFPVLEQLAVRIGRKPRVLVCIDGFSLAPEVASAYGEGAKHVGQVLSAGLARYGLPARVRPLIALEAVKQGYKPNLFASREEARQHVLALV